MRKKKTPQQRSWWTSITSIAFCISFFFVRRLLSERLWYNLDVLVHLLLKSEGQPMKNAEKRIKNISILWFNSIFGYYQFSHSNSNREQDERKMQNDKANGEWNARDQLQVNELEANIHTFVHSFRYKQICDVWLYYLLLLWETLWTKPCVRQ